MEMSIVERLRSQIRSLERGAFNPVHLSWPWRYRLNKISHLLTESGPRVECAIVDNAGAARINLTIAETDLRRLAPLTFDNIIKA